MTVLDIRSIDQLRELIGGDEAELRELINLYLIESRQILADMDAALEDENLDLLRRSAHSLKSSSQDFGATRLSQLNASLESSCRNEWPESAGRLVTQISENFTLVDSSLQAYLEGQAANG